MCGRGGTFKERSVGEGVGQRSAKVCGRSGNGSKGSGVWEEERKAERGVGHGGTRNMGWDAGRVSVVWNQRLAGWCGDGTRKTMGLVFRLS